MPDDVSALFADHPLCTAVVARVLELLDDVPGVSLRVTRSQVALRRRHGFAFVWAPGQYLRHPQAQAVLSIDLGRELVSPRIKQVAHPAPRHWMHHLELHALDDLDDEVSGWLHEAAERAA